MELKDRIEEDMLTSDFEDDFTDNLYDDDPYEDYDFLDNDSFLEEEVDNPYEGLDDICGEENAEDILNENTRFYDPMDDDDDYDSFENLERLGLY